MEIQGFGRKEYYFHQLLVTFLKGWRDIEEGSKQK